MDNSTWQNKSLEFKADDIINKTLLAKYETEKKKEEDKNKQHLTYLPNKFQRPYQWWETSKLNREDLPTDYVCKGCRKTPSEHWILNFDNIMTEQGKRRYCRRDATSWMGETYKRRI